MKNLNSLCRFIAASTLFASMTASGTAITPDAGWYGFCFNDAVGSPAEARGFCDVSGTVGEAGNTMTFDLEGPALLKVTDAFTVGDVFDVFVNSVLAFTTSDPGVLPGPAQIIFPDPAFSSGIYSAGSVLLGAGSYSVDIFVATSPNPPGGVAFVEVESTVIPIPAAAWLFGSGLIGLFGIARRKKS